MHLHYTIQVHLYRLPNPLQRNTEGNLIRNLGVVAIPAAADSPETVALALRASKYDLHATRFLFPLPSPLSSLPNSLGCAVEAGIACSGVAGTIISSSTSSGTASRGVWPLFLVFPLSLSEISFRQVCGSESLRIGFAASVFLVPSSLRKGICLINW